MAKKALLVAASAAVVLAAAVVLYLDTDDLSNAGSGQQDIAPQAEPKPDVIMTVKSSRPGCEETDSCYLPASITVGAGQPVTWVNEDSAFHSVTSGFYESPTEEFDSGYMDPYDSFTLVFEQPGTVDYFCTLHPWMRGQVIVEAP